MDFNTGWHLVFTKPRKEFVAKLNLERQGFTVYLPVRRRYKRMNKSYYQTTEPLFARYLFLYINAKCNDTSKVRSTYGCNSLVKFGDHMAKIPDNLISSLKIQEKQDSLDINSLNYESGVSVEIINGLLSGYKGLVLSKSSKHRINLLLTIAENHTQRIQVSINQIQRL